MTNRAPSGKSKILRMDGCVEHSTAYLEAAGQKIEILSTGASTMYLGRLLSVDAVHDVELDHRLEKASKSFSHTKLNSVTKVSG